MGSRTGRPALLSTALLPCPLPPLPILPIAAGLLCLQGLEPQKPMWSSYQAICTSTREAN